jgi:hypothetical protein
MSNSTYSPSPFTFSFYLLLLLNTKEELKKYQYEVQRGVNIRY